MPIYEYICIKCNTLFSALQKIGASEKDICCPSCGSNEVKKKLSSFCCSPGGGASSLSHPPFRGRGGG